MLVAIIFAILNNLGHCQMANGTGASVFTPAGIRSQLVADFPQDHGTKKREFKHRRHKPNTAIDKQSYALSPAQEEGL